MPGATWAVWGLHPFAFVGTNPKAYRIGEEALEALVLVLQRRGYEVHAPVERDGALSFEQIGALGELPRGRTAAPEPGRYRLLPHPTQPKALFGYAVGPDSLKSWLHPAEQHVCTARRKAASYSVEAATPDQTRVAFLGVRSCDLAAAAVLDRVFATEDDGYRDRRSRAFLIAVQCTESAPTCFCVSTDTGPRARGGFDLALTEQFDESGHWFLVEVGTEAGAAVLDELAPLEASQDEIDRAHAASAAVEGTQQRSIQPEEARRLLAEQRESPVWENIAERCLGCANCTMVCPTCFCTTFDDVADLTGDHVERWRRWDSCFTFQFSYTASGVVRTSTAARYRHWLTHKLSSWHEQFGSSGCVGCGRCITWCPVGIDLTEELVRLRDAVPTSPEEAL